MYVIISTDVCECALHLLPYKETFIKGIAIGWRYVWKVFVSSLITMSFLSGRCLSHGIE